MCIEEIETVREIKTHYVTVRFSERDFEKLNTLARLAGYNNRSKFIRDMLISKRMQRRNYHRTDANITKQIELLRLELKHIGVNYNQRVKTLNRLSQMQDRHGRAVFNPVDFEHDMSEMKGMMEKMLRIVDTAAAEMRSADDASAEDEEEKDDEASP